MENIIYKSSIAIHVLCGILSLSSGLIAMIVKKGSPLHNRAGKVFYWSMLIIFFTNLIFVALDPTNLKYHFFLGIGMISIYPSWSGKRVLSMKKNFTPTLIDKIAAWGIGISGFSMLVYGAYLLINKVTNTQGYAILFFVFGLLSLANAYGDLKVYLGYREPQKMQWFFAHAGKMIGAYAAAFTAFCVNIVPRYLPQNTPSFVYILTWILPGVLLAVIGRSMRIKYEKKFNIVKK